MSSTTLTDLPDEILSSIIGHLEVPSILKLGRTAKRFTHVTDEPLVWRRFCECQFRYWNDRKKFRETLANPAKSSEWKTLYKERALNVHTVTTIIDNIIDKPTDRYDRIQSIVDYGYQSKDGLMRAFYTSHLSKNHLAQRYWSYIALGCLHRNIALREWNKIKFRTDVENATERALAAFDLFVLAERREGDIDDIFDRLNSYAESVRQAYPDIDEQSPQQKAVSIALHLRQKGWVGTPITRNYHCLDHIFLGVALFNPSHAALPLISAVIYSYVCRQFGLRAQPCNYPSHVHAVVQPPEGQNLKGEPLDNTTTAGSRADTHLYMDPFNTDEPISGAVLETQIRFMAPPGTSQDDIAAVLAPVDARAMLERTARNVLNHTTSDMGPPLSSLCATYGAYFALCTFPSRPEHLLHYLNRLVETLVHHFSHDVRLFTMYILPLTQTLPNHFAYRALLTPLQQADTEQPPPKLRTPLISPTPSSSLPGSFPSSDNTTRRPLLKYKVGQIFRHRRQEYLACIYGWDPHCAMSDQWISMNRVDTLPRGRFQPFYNAYVADDGTTRYVAEENIQIIGLSLEDEDGNGDGNGNGGGSREGILTAEDVEDHFGIEVGKWFKRYDTTTGRFVSNIRWEYPED